MNLHFRAVSVHLRCTTCSCSNIFHLWMLEISILKQKIVTCKLVWNYSKDLTCNYLWHYHRSQCMKTWLNSSINRKIGQYQFNNTSPLQSADVHEMAARVDWIEYCCLLWLAADPNFLSRPKASWDTYLCTSVKFSRCSRKSDKFDRAISTTLSLTWLLQNRGR